MTCSNCPDPEFGRCPCEQMASMRGPYSQIITIKPMHDIGAASRIEQITIPEFYVGDWVKVGNLGGWIGPTSDDRPHLNAVGVVVSRRDRLYHIRFTDGVVAGYYATELYKVSVYPNGTAVEVGTSGSAVGRA